MHHRSATGAEIDLVGPAGQRGPLQASRWRGMVATRSAFDLDTPDLPAVLASMLAWLIDPGTGVRPGNCGRMKPSTGPGRLRASLGPFPLGPHRPERSARGWAVLEGSFSVPSLFSCMRRAF